MEVKWADDKHLVPKTQPDLYTMDGRRLTEVVTLADLADVVEGLREIANETDCDGPGCNRCDDDIKHPATRGAIIAQRLLAQLAPEGA